MDCLSRLREQKESLEMQFFSLLPFLIIAAGIGLVYVGVRPAMIGWAVCMLGVLVGLGVGVAVLVMGQPNAWFFALIAGLPFAIAAPMVARDLSYPCINDVTTDTENPPTFVAALSAPPNFGRNMDFPEHFGSIIRQGYPSLQPLMLEEEPEEVFQRLEKLASIQPGWKVTNLNTEKRILEGEAMTTFLRFVDDIVIRVTEQDGKSRIDMRSKSREGLLDAGMNAKRIRTFLDQVAKVVGMRVGRP